MTALWRLHCVHTLKKMGYAIPMLFLSLSLSLSHTHTHTHISLTEPNNRFQYVHLNLCYCAMIAVWRLHCVRTLMKMYLIPTLILHTLVTCYVPSVHFVWINRFLGYITRCNINTPTTVVPHTAQIGIDIMTVASHLADEDIVTLLFDGRLMKGTNRIGSMLGR